MLEVIIKIIKNLFIKKEPTTEIKHFADGFHEGRWEDDMEDNKRPSLLDETPTDGYANMSGC